MLRTQRNIENVFVAGNITKTASRAGKTLSALKANELAVLTPGGVVMAAANIANYDRFKLGYKNSSGNYIVSNSIKYSTIKNYKGAVSAAGTEQVDYIGYNATSGDIEAIDSNLYTMRISFFGDTTESFTDQYIKRGTYKSDSSCTSKEVAKGLLTNLIHNFDYEKEYRIKFERVSDASRNAVGTGVDDVVFTNGSPYFSATDIDDDTGGDALAVGDAILVGTAASSPVYIITEIDAVSNIGKLDVPFQGSTETIADTGLKRLDSADLAAAQWGLKLTGVAKDFVVGQKPYSKLRWSVLLEDFGTTTEVTNSVSASLGVGTYQHVAEAEWFAQGNEGGQALYRSRANAPAYVSRADATSGEYYSILSFDFAHEMDSGIGPQNSSPKSILIAYDAGSTAATGVTATAIIDATDGVSDVLDAIVVAAGVGTAQQANI